MSTGRPIIILKKGMLTKCSKYLRNWNERYVVLTNERFLTYEKEDPEANCTLDLFLNDIYYLKSSEGQNNEFSFECDGKNYRFQTKTNEEMQEWLTAIDSALSEAKTQALQPNQQ